MEKEKLLRQYRELDRDCARLSNFEPEDGQKRTGLFIPDESGMADMWERWNKLKKQTEELEEPDAVFSLVKHHFQDFLESLEYTLQDTQEHPESRYLWLHWEVENTSRLNRHPDEERYEKLMKSMEELAKAKDQILGLIQKKQSPYDRLNLSGAFLKESQTIGQYREQCEQFFPTFSEEQRKKLEASMSEMQALLTDMADALAEGAQEKPKIQEDDLTRTVKMEEEEYRTLLRKKLGVSLDELLSWYKEEMEKTREEVFSIAAKLDIPEPAPKTMQEVNDILFKYEAPCKSPEEMLNRANEYLKRTRALAHKYVRLPDDESCCCVAVPESCKDSYPWGGYEGGDFSIRPLRGQMFLNTYNYQNVTDGWIKLNSLHEAYPGHHVQYVRTAVDPRPETVKIGAKLVPVLEGTCLRTERAFEDLFSEDPFFPLFVAYRRHHASVRICADLMLFYFGATIEDVVRLYEKELGFDRGTARGQVQAQQNTPGYFTCYYYGMKKICEWEKEYGFSKKDYTELLFSAGYISIERLGELVKMTEEERQRYYHEFESLCSEEKCNDKE